MPISRVGKPRVTSKQLCTLIVELHKQNYLAHSIIKRTVKAMIKLAYALDPYDQDLSHNI